MVETDGGVVLMDGVDVIEECNVMKDDETEVRLVECATVGVNVDDDVSNNDDDDNDDIRLDEGDDEAMVVLDEELSIKDLVVMVTKLELPFVAVKVPACEKVLLTLVAVGNADETVACDDEITGSEELKELSTDDNEDDNVNVVESDCWIEDESEVVNLVVITDADDDCDRVGDDSGCKVLILVLTRCDVLGTDDSSCVVKTNDDGLCVAKLEFPTKEVENNLLDWKGVVDTTTTDDEVMFTVQFRPVKLGEQMQV